MGGGNVPAHTNFAHRLKALKGKTPYQLIEEQWSKNPQLFHPTINTFIAGLNI